MQFKNPEDFHNKIGFAFHAMLAVPLAAFIYLFLEIKNKDFQAVLAAGNRSSIVTGVLLLMSIAGVAYSYRLFKKSRQKAGEEQTLPRKLTAYYKSAIIFYALLEMSSGGMVLGLYLTASSLFIIGYMFVLLLLSLNRPTPQKYVSDLRLGKEEGDIIRQKKPFEGGDS